jgi:hypothetical protein
MVGLVRARLILRQSLEIVDHRQVIIGQLDVELPRLLRVLTQCPKCVVDRPRHSVIVRLRRDQTERSLDAPHHLLRVLVSLVARLLEQLVAFRRVALHRAAKR